MFVHKSHRDPCHPLIPNNNKSCVQYNDIYYVHCSDTSKMYATIEIGVITIKSMHVI